MAESRPYPGNAFRSSFREIIHRNEPFRQIGDLRQKESGQNLEILSAWTYYSVENQSVRSAERMVRDCQETAF